MSVFSIKILNSASKVKTSNPSWGHYSKLNLKAQYHDQPTKAQPRYNPEAQIENN